MARLIRDTNKTEFERIMTICKMLGRQSAIVDQVIHEMRQKPGNEDLVAKLYEVQSLGNTICDEL